MAQLKSLTVNDTGTLQVASGTTAQRATPTNGDMRFNTETQKMEMYVGGVWTSADGSVSNHGVTTVASGGSVTTSGGYRIHTFTSVGSTTFTVPYTGRVEVLVVAGGGGGAPIGGGGGAGGYIYNANFPVVAGSNYTAVVGGGGQGSLHHYSSEGTQGGASSFSGPTGTISATGGGKGAPYNQGGTIAQWSGGSGGGGPGGVGIAGTVYSSYPGEHPGGLGIVGQGHPGGFGHHGTGPGYPNPGGPDGGANHAGGGGGGAGSKGQNRSSNRIEAFGGQGLTNSISGSPVIYAAGGGGGTHQNNTYGYGPSRGGALDGTGNAGTHGGAVATAGGTNRGGGGGGGAHPGGENPGGAGGPGVVIVRYRY